MKRGEIWTVRGSSGWIEKARPALIVQDESFDDIDSTVTCLFTTYDSSNANSRVRVEPSSANGLRRACYVMTDKIVSVKKMNSGRLSASWSSTILKRSHNTSAAFWGCSP